MTAIDLVAKVGPSGILATGCYFLWKDRQTLAAELRESQEKRIEESKAYAAEKRQDSKENTQALLAIAERTHQALERLDESR